MNTLLKTMVVVFFFVSLTGCEKDGNSGANGNLAFHLHTMIGNTAAAYGTEFQKDGRKFNISDFRYYISNIVLKREDNTTYAISGKVVLAGPTQHTYELGEVPSGDYTGFSFMLGLDSTTNHSDPTLRDATDPLAIQSPSIHWSWNSGYIFCKIEGLVDTTAAANGSADYDYFYHVGTDALKRTIEFNDAPFTVGSGENEIGLEFDLLTILTNVNMRTENETHTFNDLPLATKIADNWQDAFSLE
ncbi:hypothetical protein K1X84_11760 [bacterium]|nr:hypothetical protein [bacterium]